MAELDRYYIPAWDYAYAIQQYLNPYRIVESAEARKACVDGIAESARFAAVTELIYKKNVRG